MKDEEFEFTYVGDIDNWEKFRDLLIFSFMECDTKERFDKLIGGLILSLGFSPEELQKTRKELGVKPFSEKEFAKLKKMFKQNERRNRRKNI